MRSGGGAFSKTLEISGEIKERTEKTINRHKFGQGLVLRAGGKSLATTLVSDNLAFRARASSAQAFPSLAVSGPSQRGGGGGGVGAVELPRSFPFPPPSPPPDLSDPIFSVRDFPYAKKKSNRSTSSSVCRRESIPSRFLWVVFQ